MRLPRLELQAFGHFEDHTLELDHPSGGLHFVVGPNEAGKSTIRAAIRMALFGPTGLQIAGRPTTSTRIRAHLLPRTDGPPLIVDRHGRRDPRDPDGTVIDTNVLTDLVPIGTEVFDRLFCLGHDELRRHAHDLLQTEGGLGQIVFGAALGGGLVGEVTSDLGKQIAELFKPKGASRIGKQFDALQDIEVRLTDTQLTADHWAEQALKLETLKQELETCGQQLDGLAQDESRLKRVQATAGTRSKLDEARRRRADASSAGPTLDEVDIERLRSAIDSHGEAIETIAALTAKIGELQSERDAIPDDDQLLAHSAAITALVEQKGQYRTAVAETLRLQRALDGGDDLPEPDRISSAVADLEPLVGTARQLPAAHTELAKQRTKLHAVKDRLGLGDIGDAEVVKLAVPTTDAIEATRVELHKLTEARTGLDDDLSDIDERISETRGQLDGDGRRRSVPTASEIETARDERRTRWAVVRAWFVDGTAPDHGPSDRATVADELEQTVERVDSLVDEILVDTRHAAEVQSLRQQLANLEGERQKVVALQTERTAAIEAAMQTWRSAWEGIASDVSTPEEMSRWRTDWEQLVVDLEELRSEEAAAAEAQTRLDDARERLAEAHGANGRTPRPDEEFLSLFETASSLAEAETTRRSARETIRVHAAFITGIDTQVAELSALLPTPLGAVGEAAIGELNSCCADQQRNREDRERLANEIAQLRSNLAEVSGTRDAMDKIRQQFASRLGVTTDHLAEVCSRSEEVVDLGTRIEELETTLLDMGSGLSVAELLAEAADAGSPDQIAARLDGIAGDRTHLGERRDELFRQGMLLELALGKAAGGDDAAVLAIERQLVIGSLAETTDEVRTLLIARELLNKVVERAGTRGETDLVDRAGAYFSKLTNGEFERLDLDRRGDAVHAVAVRRDGSRIYPTALSDGTLDQLWLSWRLAGIEHHVHLVGTVPVIVDDVLVHFDDERAGAAIVALAELSQHTQVIVLTHHPHLVEVARARLGAERVEVTELGPRPESATAIVQVIDSGAATVAPLPATAAAGPTNSTSGGAAATGEHRDPAASLLAVLDDQWRGKTELLGRCGIGGQWPNAIKALINAGLAEQEGQKRGAKYRRVVA